MEGNYFFARKHLVESEIFEPAFCRRNQFIERYDVFRFSRFDCVLCGRDHRDKHVSFLLQVLIRTTADTRCTLICVNRQIAFNKWNLFVLKVVHFLGLECQRVRGDDVMRK